MNYNLSKRIEEALNIITSLNFESLECGKYVVNEDFYYLVQKYETKSPDKGRYEAHKKYVDIQYIVEGEEQIHVSDSTLMEEDEPYNVETDVIFLKEPKHTLTIVLTTGKYTIFYPEDAHKPGLYASGCTTVKKILGKVRI